MPAPLVSILIPCYNAAPFLAETLQSALAQTWPNSEIIVVDDGSSDDSCAIARIFADRGVRLVEQANQGAAAARNHALRISRGDYIQYLDADDLISPDKIHLQMELLAQRPSDALATCAWGRFRGELSQARFVNDEVFRDFSAIEFLVLAGETGAMMHPSAWLSPRSVLEKAGPWDERLSLNDDGEYFCRVALAGNGLHFCADPAVKSYYRSGIPTSLSKRRNAAARRSQFLSLELITAALLRAEDTPRTRAACAGYWRRFVFDFYPHPVALIRRAEEAVEAMGGTVGSPRMGPKTALLARIIGWRLLWRLRDFSHQ